MTRPDDWDSLRYAWRPTAETTATLYDAEVADLMARAVRARRTLSLVAAAEMLITALAVAGIGAALRHAASIVEAILGFSVSLAIVSVWIARAADQRKERKRADAPSMEYLAVLRGVRQRQIRFVHFGWLVLGLELVFLVVWWAGGFWIHRGQLGAPIAIASLWVPLVIMAGLIAWTARMRRTAVGELDRLRRLERELRAE